MATLLIKLNGSEADEIDEICELLDSHHIEYYETNAGRWGFSVAGIWLPDDSQLEQAQKLLGHYQHERYQRVHTEYEALKQSDQHDTFLRRTIRQPLMVLIYILAAASIIYLSLLPFMKLME
ncbi:MAG: hypothetical protein HUJ30_06725 [Gammaproteobacteria bacterium]|nr:hypothetical protein [Gammaproteobacteria bacterium]